MGVKIEGFLKPGKKVELHHIQSGTRITTAAPLDNNGDGSSFSPTDLASASLIACAMTVMSIVAERNSYDLSGTHATIEKIMQDSPRRIAELPITFHMPTALEATAREKLERTAHTCPVFLSLLPDIKIAMNFLYDVV